MEIHKNIDKSKYNIILTNNYLDYFHKALDFVMNNYKEDYDRIANTKFGEITPEFFFREFCWCCCTSGFNAKVVSKFFPALLSALEPLFKIILINSKSIDIENIRNNSLKIFNNKRKIQAIIDCALLISNKIEQLGWKQFRDLELNTPEKLEQLPFIGPITKYHLARNIGLLEFMKFDLHLTRLSQI